MPSIWPITGRLAFMIFDEEPTSVFQFFDQGQPDVKRRRPAQRLSTLLVGSNLASNFFVTCLPLRTYV